MNFQYLQATKMVSDFLKPVPDIMGIRVIIGVALILEYLAGRLRYKARSELKTKERYMSDIMYITGQISDTCRIYVRTMSANISR